jgi:hypothetical protein
MLVSFVWLGLICGDLLHQPADEQSEISNQKGQMAQRIAELAVELID